MSRGISRIRADALDSTASGSSSSPGRILEGGTYWFLVTVVVIQVVHMFEHVIQLLQVTVWHVPDDEALGLLGYVLQIQGTEEWLHLFFILALLTSLWLLLGRIRAASPTIVPTWAYRVYLIGAGDEPSDIDRSGLEPNARMDAQGRLILGIQAW